MLIRIRTNPLKDVDECRRARREALTAIWNRFFTLLECNRKVVAMGYMHRHLHIPSQTENEALDDAPGDRFIFALFSSSNNTKKENDEDASESLRTCEINRNDVSECFYCMEGVQMTCLLSYLLHPRSPLLFSLVIVERERELAQNDKVDLSTTNKQCIYMKISLGARRATMLSLLTLEDRINDVLDQRLFYICQSRSHVHIIVQVSVDAENRTDGGGGHFSISECVHWICNVVERRGASLVRVDADAPRLAHIMRSISQANPSQPFYTPDWPTTEGSDCSCASAIDSRRCILDNMPNCLRRRVPCTVDDTVSCALALLQSHHLQIVAEGAPLTQSNLQELKDQMKERRFFVRRRAQGTRVLIGVNAHNGVFLVDVHSAAVLLLPPTNVTELQRLQKSLFVGTLTSTYRHACEYRIIVDDVFMYRSCNIARGATPFSERLKCLHSVIADHEGESAFKTKHSVAIIRADYVDARCVRELLAVGPLCDYPTMGLRFVGDREGTAAADTFGFAQDKNTYVWTPPDSTTALFSVMDIEKASVDGAPLDEYVRRARLGVLGDDDTGVGTCGLGEKYVAFQSEYVDFDVQAYPHMERGWVVECLLRVEPNAVHWWDIVRIYPPYTYKRPYTFSHVYALVNGGAVAPNELSGVECATKRL